MDPDLHAESSRLASLRAGDADDLELLELFTDACGRLARLLSAAVEAGDQAAIRQHADAVVGLAEAVGLQEAAALAQATRDGDARLHAVTLVGHLMELLQAAG